MKKRHLIAAVALFCALAAAMAAVWHAYRPVGQEGNKSFTVEVCHSDESVTAISCQSSEEFLGAYLLSEGIISGCEGPYGLYVDTVDGERAVYEEDGAWWSLSCDGESSQLGVDSVPIQDGSTYTWSYTVQ